MHWINICTALTALPLITHFKEFSTKENKICDKIRYFKVTIWKKTPCYQEFLKVITVSNLGKDLTFPSKFTLFSKIIWNSRVDLFLWGLLESMSIAHLKVSSKDVYSWEPEGGGRAAVILWKTGFRWGHTTSWGESPCLGSFSAKIRWITQPEHFNKQNAHSLHAG